MILRLFTGVFFVLLMLETFPVFSASPSRFGEGLCEDPRLECQEIQKGDSWKSLWPDDAERQLVMSLNRMNIRLREGMKIAVPKEMGTPKNDFSPLPKTIDAPGEKQIQVDLKQLAWGAYDEKGNLVNWGPVSSGKDWCPDTGHRCRTPAGNFHVIRKEGEGCKSSKFPIPKGGAPMPYCMFFKSDYAIHGSYELPGYRASHGCVRILPEDAQWLNENFIELPDAANSLPGTAVLIRS
ncbi:MAG: L,D-transpeptidase [bacterium]